MATDDAAPEVSPTMNITFTEKSMQYIMKLRGAIMDEIEALDMAIAELQSDFDCCSTIAERLKQLERAREQMWQHSERLIQEHLILDEMLETWSMETDALSAIEVEGDQSRAAMDENNEMNQAFIETIGCVAVYLGGDLIQFPEFGPIYITTSSRKVKHNSTRSTTILVAKDNLHGNAITKVNKED
ncbi:hypothetical protein CAPTEDRAFT_203264 [Capitella teleta]|uniref:Uncharacterized protein n=1 Tax=Capitella teleta TaxID=283909 RepID=R7U133_CAPTE|nr:hypothetical protein CAPTEDRAFT_203264 [Capitella teleta]|eukprot:ELT96895.1 hypothetical protein CAPTEDRAFT_203264 [Capitella teleta]